MKTKERKQLYEKPAMLVFELRVQTGLLQEIDKKIDVINEKVSNSAEIGDLKIKPIEEKVNNIQDNNKWLWRTMVGAIIGLLIEAVFTIKSVGG